MCKSLYFHKVAELTLAQVFSCEFCGISENTSGPLVAASAASANQNCY